MEGRESLRQDARDIFLAGVEAADPRRAVMDHLHRGPGGGLLIAGKELRGPGSLKIVAIGKASCAMADAAMAAMQEQGISPDLLDRPGIAVVNRENATELDDFDVLETGHPLPDEAGVRAAARIEKYLAPSTTADGVLVLVSGGGSALLPAPVAGLTLDDKRAVTELLLAGGADIREVNTVRKHLSRLKGGGLARAAAPAAVEVLILSDVFDDDLSSIASGPAVPDPTTFADAIGVLKKYDLWDRVPAAPKARLIAGADGEISDTPKPGDSLFSRVCHTIIGSNSLSLEAASTRTLALGYAVDVFKGPLTGEAREAAEFFHARLRSAAQLGEESGVHHAFLAGGETTVTLRGGGKGGRNQEMALAVAVKSAGLDDFPWVFLSGGTDGRDGPTDAAGGVVDAATVTRGREAGADPERALRENDSYSFLKASGDLLMTGGTGTNVADLQVLLYTKPD